MSALQYIACLLAVFSAVYIVSDMPDQAGSNLTVHHIVLDQEHSRHSFN